uniref:Alpha-carbonic anhydrase domain-containing protein n=1 Tax=Meloidogyne javanica TaxID=6303 RepID=A0A915LTQ8_MELJA
VDYITALLTFAKAMNDSEFNKEIVSAMDSKCKGSIAEATTNYNLMMFALIVALFGIGYMFYCHVMSMYDGRQRELQTTVNELVAEIRGQPYSNRRDHNIQPINNTYKQSPINISPASTAYDLTISNPFFGVNYANKEYCVKNSDGLCIIPTATRNLPSFQCGVFRNQIFYLEKIMINWGTSHNNGSLHTINNEGFAAEIQFIHRNKKFTNLSNALNHPEEPGALFIAVLLREATDDNQILEPLIAALPNVVYDSGTHSSRLNNFNPSLLLEFIRNHQFWLYEGSEAYEPFRETVQWLVSRSVLSISPQQLGELRVLRKTPQGSDLSQPLLSTRALQPLNDRVVRSSFIWH